MPLIEGLTASVLISATAKLSEGLSSAFGGNKKMRIKIGTKQAELAESLLGSIHQGLEASAAEHEVNERGMIEVHPAELRTLALMVGFCQAQVDALGDTLRDADDDKPPAG